MLQNVIVIGPVARLLYVAVVFFFYLLSVDERAVLFVSLKIIVSNA